MTIKADDALREEGLGILKKLNEPMAPSLSIVLEALVVAEKRGALEERKRIWNKLNEVRNTFIKLQMESAHLKATHDLYKTAAMAADSLIQSVAPLQQEREFHVTPRIQGKN